MSTKSFLLLLCFMQISSTFTSESSLSLESLSWCMPAKPTQKTTVPVSWKALLLLGLLGSTVANSPSLHETECKPTKLTTPLTNILPYYEDFRHPGKITVSSALEDRDQLNLVATRLEKRLADTKKINDDMELPQKVKVASVFSPALLGTCVIDDPMTADDLVDRKNHAIALEKFQKTGVLRAFGAVDENALIALLRSVNAWLQKGDVSELSTFRIGSMAVLTQYGKYHEVVATRRFLQTEVEALSAYDYLVDELIRTNRAINSVKVWQHHLLSVALNPSHPSHWWVKTQLVVLPGETSRLAVRRKLERIFLQTKTRLADPFDAAAYLHMELVKLHPFEDGNGGTARLFVVGLLTWVGYLPPLMWSNKEYMAVVNESIKKNDHTIFAQYLKKMACRTESIFMNDRNEALFKKLITLIKEAHFECLETLVSENERNCAENLQDDCDNYMKQLGLKKEEPVRISLINTEL